MTIDELAQLIRRVDGNHTLGAGELAEALHHAIPGLEAMADLEAALDKEWAYSAELKQQLAAAREALALFLEFDDAGEPPGDVCFEKARATLQRDRQP